MKRIIVITGVFLIVLSLSGSHLLFAEPTQNSFFNLSNEKIKEAIEYGQKANYTINAWGNIDFGLNKYYLDNNTGHVQILTPFILIAQIARAKFKDGNSLSTEDASKYKNHFVSIEIDLYLDERDVEDEEKINGFKKAIQCSLATNSKKIDLAEESLGSGFACCGINEPVASFSYNIAQEMLEGARTSILTIQHPLIGEKKIEINWDQIK